MAGKTFRSAKAPVDPATLRQVAADAGRVLPAAVVARSSKRVMINVKVSEELARSLAEHAEAEGLTQKQVITRALAAAGLAVQPHDLEDLTPRRRLSTSG